MAMLGGGPKCSAQLFSSGPCDLTTLAANAHSDRFIASATAGSSASRLRDSSESEERL